MRDVRSSLALLVMSETKANDMYWTPWDSPNNAERRRWEEDRDERGLQSLKPMKLVLCYFLSSLFLTHKRGSIG